MMILHVTYTMKPGAREAFIRAIEEAGIDVATRAEEGCVQYDFFYAAQKADTVLLVEQWENADVLKTHTTMPHYKQLGALKEQYVLSTAIEKFAGERV